MQYIYTFIILNTVRTNKIKIPEKETFAVVKIRTSSPNSIIQLLSFFLSLYSENLFYLDTFLPHLEIFLYIIYTCIFTVCTFLSSSVTYSLSLFHSMFAA